MDSGMVIKVAFVVVFFAATIYIGFRTRKTALNVDGFVLGGRKVGPWLSAFAYGVTYFSAVVFIGYAGQFGWKYGMAALWIGLGNAFLGSLLAWYVLGARTRAMTHHLNTKTMPEFFGSRFNSKPLRIAAAALVFVFLIPYTASVYNGLSRLFFMAFGLPYEYAIIGMAVLTCIYVVLGGYMATAVNDLVQGVIMIVGIIAIIASVLAGHGGFSEAVVTLSQVTNDTGLMEGMKGTFTSMFGPNLPDLLGVLILTSLGVWGLPQMVTKFYAMKNTAPIRLGAIVSTLFALLIAGGSYFLGGFGRLIADNPTLYNDNGAVVYDRIVPALLADMPDLLIGLTVVLVVAASISTLAALVMTSSSTLTLDLIKGNIVKKMTDKSQLITIRSLIVVFVIIAATIALVQYNSSVIFIAQMMSISWGALAGSFLAPFVYGLYWKRTTTASVWACFIFAVGLVCSNLVFGFIASPINAGAIAMVGGLVIVPLVSLITPKPNKEKTDLLFEESYKDLHKRREEIEKEA